MDHEPVLQRLCHDPYGAEHPYDQGPTERVPRDPQAGQAVTLGVITRPAGAAQAVWATWRADGVSEERAAGEWARDDEECSCWLVRLPAFADGERVTYHLHARQGERELSAGPWSFFVPGWRTTGDVRGYDLAADGLALDCLGDGASRVRFTIALLGGRHFRLRYQVGGDPQPPGRDTAAAELWRLEEASSERLVAGAGGLRLVVHRCPCRLELQRWDGSPLLAEAQPLAWLSGEGGRPLRLRQSFASPHAEAFYGFGERYNALDQRGNALDVRVYEQYRTQGRRTYLPVPFFYSSRGYGVYLATSRHVVYDLAAAQPDRWSHDVQLGPDGALEAHVFTGQPRQILAAYAELTGRPALPPAWAFGPWMSSNEWNSQAVVLEQAHKTVELGIPATVLVIEAWSDESTFYIWNDAQYALKSPADPPRYRDFAFPPAGRWPDPKGMIDELHRLGLRVILWQIPVLKKLAGPHPQHDADWAYAIAQGYVVREADGRPYHIRPGWFHGGLLLDFSNPEAVGWWLGKRAYLLDELGVDGLKTDGGEHLWGESTGFAGGRRGDELWNAYPNLYVGSYHRFARERRGGDAVTFSRAGSAGAQAYPCHWAGDEASTWEAFRASILAGLNAGLSGIPFWGWDLAGFSGEVPSAELYLRAAAMAAFCPIMQYHSEPNEHRRLGRDRTPWNIQKQSDDPGVIPAFRRFANLRMRLLPYILQEAEKCCATGLPLMRALPLEYPADPGCRDFPYQYLFGESLLVAPVVMPGCECLAVYLPEGEWVDLWTGASYTGPRALAYPTPRDVIPVFAKAGPAARWIRTLAGTSPS